jgi:hypothetical protein
VSGSGCPGSHGWTAERVANYWKEKRTLPVESSPTVKKQIPRWLAKGGPIGVVLAGLVGFGGWATGALVLEPDPPADVQLDCTFVGWQQVPEECVCVPLVAVAAPGLPAMCPHPDHTEMLLTEPPGLYCECAEPELSIDDARMLVTR